MSKVRLNTYAELLDYLNNNHNYLIFRGFNFPINNPTHDIDILLKNNEKIPEINFPREIHFQYKEKHKGLIFMTQSALNRKVWNGKYYEPCRLDIIKMNILRKVKKIYTKIIFAIK